MTDWLKIIGTVMAACFLVWNLVQTHEYRINQLEDGFKSHLDKHDEQYRDIQKELRDLNINITKLSSGRAADGR